MSFDAPLAYADQPLEAPEALRVRTEGGVDTLSGSLGDDRRDRAL